MSNSSEPSPALASDAAIIDPRDFRTVLGNFPTSVVAITSTSVDGEPIAMIVGSFTSVSLDPPLVSFLADEGSSTFGAIQRSGRYCANVLAADQESVARLMSKRGVDRFAGLSWSRSANGNPVIDGAVAWVDCEISEVLTLGDHYMAVGRVNELAVSSTKTPLLFFRGGFGDYYSATALLLDRLTLTHW